ncbi:MAG: hypothetical protein G01um10142_28 [Parcubacteria group bacterium Gr01-1014_2]|nr:MAG: hypothetical protein G01um10142_28 [Parcubacteria group bacterium Gr01-1014_2]
MAEDRKKKGGEPVLEFFWDSLELAADKTYSTTLRIKLTGWWEGGRPKEVGVSVYEKGQEPPAGYPARIQNGFGTSPLVGLLPGHHYLVVVYIGDRLPVQKMITVPELPKPAKPEEEALGRERTGLERARVASEKRKLIVQEKEPTRDEKETASVKAKTERVKAEKQLKEAKQSLKQVEPTKPRQIKVLHTYKRFSRLEVVLQRIGKDGKPEDGGISVLDFEQGGIVFGDATGDFPSQIKNWGIVVVCLAYFEYPRRVTFFLPDDLDAEKTVVDVPAREQPKPTKEEKPVRIIRPSLWERMREAYVVERDKGKTWVSPELKIQRRTPLIFRTDLSLRDSSQGGQDGKDRII